VRGQVVGGVIVTSAGWRWALLINVPIGLVLLALAPRHAAARRAPRRAAGPRRRDRC
jgi:DHA2 family methylenomycin A resistance protein-like MFS transporter